MKILLHRQDGYGVTAPAPTPPPPPPPPGGATWLEGVAVNQWYSIPNTALSSVEPVPRPLNQSPANRVSAWCGTALKRTDSVVLIGAAGGHGDYHGNEVTALALNTPNPAWATLRGPTPDAQIIRLTPVYLDLRRSSLHTYWATQFDQLNNRMLIVSDGGPHGSTPTLTPTPTDWPWPQNDGTFMGFDLGTNDWTHPDYLPALPVAVGSADLCCTHPTTGEIYLVHSQSGLMHKYTPSLGGAGAWSVVGSYFMNGAYRGSAIDPIRNRMLIVGSFGGTVDAVVRNTLNASAVTPVFDGLGAAALRVGGYPGVVYDEENDRFLVFVNTSPAITVYAVTPHPTVADAWTVSLLTTTGTTPLQRPNGIHNSAQYVPELKGVVFINSYAGNAQFLRLG